MAVTLTQAKFTVDLQNLVYATIQTVVQTRQKENARKEAAFQKVVAEGMSYADQLAYREKQLETEKKSAFSDPDFIVQLETEVGTAKKQVRFEKVRNAYTASLNDYISGKGSLDTYEKVLSDSLSFEADPDMTEKLQGLLSEVIQKRATIETNAVKNRVTVAEEDQSIPLIDQTIKEVQVKRANAAVNGDDDEAAMWDDALFGLKQSRTKVQVDTAANELSFKINKNNPTADQQLSYYDDMVNVADKSTPITYDGIQYASAAALWGDERSKYIAKDYFVRKSNEIDAKTDQVAAMSPNGTIPPARIDGVQGEYDKLMTQPGFENFAVQIEQAKTAKTSEIANDLYQSRLDEAQAQMGLLADPLGADYAQTKKIYDDTDRFATTIESRYNIQIIRQSTPEEMKQGKTVLNSVLNAPVKSASSEANQAEIDRAKQVWHNADTLAGTGKYVGQTADQVRAAAHNYAEDINAGRINMDAPAPTPSQAVPVTPTPAVTPRTTPVADTSGFGGTPKSVAPVTKTPVAAKPNIVKSPAPAPVTPYKVLTPREQEAQIKAGIDPTTGKPFAK